MKRSTSWHGHHKLLILQDIIAGVRWSGWDRSSANHAPTLTVRPGIGAEGFPVRDVDHFNDLAKMRFDRKYLAIAQMAYMQVPSRR